MSSRGSFCCESYESWEKIHECSWEGYTYMWTSKNIQIFSRVSYVHFLSTGVARIKEGVLSRRAGLETMVGEEVRAS